MVYGKESNLYSFAIFITEDEKAVLNVWYMQPADSLSTVFAFYTHIRDLLFSFHFVGGWQASLRLFEERNYMALSFDELLRHTFGCSMKVAFPRGSN